ncbi:WD40 repeat domain-containing protein [Jiangella endophytica]|uniref:hypothetical protein n=1 Tax=Jiangella endophytica TaxID=1623398 RepID=UPI000E354B69|nr:hypothetical protein [Jiangella endophytica]
MTLDEQRLRDALDEFARGVPPRAGLADAVLRQASRRRTVLRLAAAGGTAVAVAAGTTFVLTDPLPAGRVDLGSVDPAAAPPAPAQTPAPDPVIDADLDALPAGAAAAVPWYSGGVIHHGAAEVPFDVEFAAIRSLSAVAGGYVVLTADAEGQDGNELWLVSSGGERTRLARGAVYSMAVSADGALLGWAEHDWSAGSLDDGPGRTLLYVADAATGEVRHRREQTGADGPVGSVRGFLGPGRVVVDSATNAPSGVYVWDLEADTVTPWTEFGFTTAVSPTGELAAVVPPNEAADRSPAVVDGVTGEVRWRAPQNATIGTGGFSPDGRYVAEVLEIGPPPAELPRTPGALTSYDYAYEIVVADAATGAPVRTIRGLQPAVVTWEPDGALLVQAAEDDRTALVRCFVDGGCELADPIRDTSDGRPYDLGSGL